MATLLSPFYQKLSTLPREELLTVIEAQDVALIKQVNRIEWVFRNKLQHLHWADGTPVTERDLTTEELSLLIDEPFSPKNEWTELGLTIEQQRQLHTAQDPVLWAKNFLKIEPRVYQILMLRYPSLRRVLRSGRRIGKSFTMSILMLHWAYTHNLAKVLVVAPMKAHVELLYDAVLELAKNNSVVYNSIRRKVKSPQFAIELSNGSTIRFFTSGLRCLTPDHEVLTRNGWKFIDSISVGEEIVGWQLPERGEGEGSLYWASVDDTYSYEYDGKLLVHNTPHLSFKVTPNHNFISRTHARGAKWKWRYAEDMIPDVCIPYTGKELLPDKEVYSGDELELWGWWISEGSGFIGNSARFSQKKAFGFERIQLLARRLGFNPKVYTYGHKASEIRVLGWKPPIFSGKVCYDKFIPRELFAEKHRDRLIDGLVGGDGWRRRDGWEYYSVSEQLIHDVQELAVLIGSNTYMSYKENWDSVSYNLDGSKKYFSSWRVSVYPNNQKTRRSGGTKIKDRSAHLSKWGQGMNWEDYSGKVHCLNVPESGAFLVRHNGKVHVTGNSGGKADIVRGQEAHLIILDELDFMHPDDLISIYAMLQQTQEGQEPKVLVGASTPTGRKENFYEWCISDNFKEFWYPSYVNPNWTQETETEFRRQYITELSYRHEVEADWGDNAEGVYPIRLVDWAFKSPGWRYNSVPRPKPRDSETFYVMGVDWDKYSAGVNICVLEVCDVNYPEERFRNKIRLVFREETLREEYTLSKGIMRVIELNAIMGDTLRHIYIDRGNGEVQSEQLSKYGVDNPHSGLKQKLRPVQFAESLEMRDPATQEIVKKDIKPFMIDNLRQFLEQDHICFPEDDEELYRQLISYEVARITPTGKPIFEMAGGRPDHAHDALILACLAITENYGELMRQRFAMRAAVVSNETFLPMFGLSDNPEIREWEVEKAQEVYGSLTAAPLAQKRAMTVRLRTGSARPVKRSMF